MEHTENKMNEWGETIFLVSFFIGMSGILGWLTGINPFLILGASGICLFIAKKLGIEILK